ncbi:MAG: 2-oxoglutarate dehydrogenase E1 component [Leptospiraceae bacterium]|nr:2-oxoglutarate dehydrogenase E1 component [Leptospiraceae bacterium]
MNSSILYGDQANQLEELYERYLEDRSSVSDDWARFFDSLGNGRSSEAIAPSGSLTGGGALAGERRKAQAVQQLVLEYRRQGYLASRLDPLGIAKPDHSRLELSLYGLSDADLNEVFESGVPALGARPLKEIIEYYESIYCGSVGCEHFYLRNSEERDWFQERIESPDFNAPLDKYTRLRLFEKVYQAEHFEHFLATKYVGKKRFSIEGGESLIPLLDTAIEHGGQEGLEGMVIGMAHRGRLNVLVNVLEKPAGLIFAEFDENYNPETIDYADVKYHLGHSNRKMTRSGREVALSLLFNPSHLEAVDPVVLGSVRARQRVNRDEERKKYLPVLIHGDAAFVGQGVVAESLNFMNLEGYRMGGCLHIIVNNQIGFTTLPSESRSTRFATDLAKGFQIPIFHVNGDDPEAVFRVARLCMDYRNEFGKDAIIDLICYRKLGHNETDEPAFTQPRMYDVIRKHSSLATIYEQKIRDSGITEDEIQFIKDGINEGLEHSFKKARESNTRMQVDTLRGVWSGYARGELDSEPETRLLAEQLERVGQALVNVPEGFNIHKKLHRLIDMRKKMLSGEQGIDWGMAEALAFGSILENGHDIRMSGQDVRRGTFSHRHAAFVDTTDDSLWIPLNGISEKQGILDIHNSPLSEYSVVGYEYGYSLSDPNALVVWEAQFGDFVNGAQIIIDQFISSSEIKWYRMSGLVMLLPHGYEGQGPEHSSARLERFLQLCARNNMYVVNCTTPAQYFHLLRRQILSKVRRPLIVMTPKSLLRHPMATSSLEDVKTGIFEELIVDPDLGKEEILLFCSGKIYYDLRKAMDEKGAGNVALMRLEQMYPFPEKDIKAALEKSSARSVRWVQEEPVNQGAWQFVEDRFNALLQDRRMEVVARPESPSPAAGLHSLHASEQQEIIDRALS